MVAEIAARAGALQRELDEMGVGRPVTKRGTSNGNSSGSAEDRRRRRAWLLETYRANEDAAVAGEGENAVIVGVPIGQGEPACRCYRCGKLLTIITLTVDRIIPGCKGGTYRRNNIRPACSDCNEKTGGKLAHRNKPKIRRKCTCSGFEHRQTCPSWTMTL